MTRGARAGPRRAALVAGGTGALARAPRALVETGWAFALIGRAEAQARAAEEAFRRAGGEALGIAADVLRDGAISEAFARVEERFGAPPAAVVWNVGFVPWPAPEGWDPGALAKAARDEARALGSLGQAAERAWARAAGGAAAATAGEAAAAEGALVVTIEGHSGERAAGPAPIVAVVRAIREAALERLAATVPGLRRSRVLLGALPSGPAGEGRWLSQDEVAQGVAEALASGAPRVVAGDLALAEELARRYRWG